MVNCPLEILITEQNSGLRFSGLRVASCEVRGKSALSHVQLGNERWETYQILVERVP